jgi:IstB-like ATP binding protein
VCGSSARPGGPRYRAAAAERGVPAGLEALALACLEQPAQPVRGNPVRGPEAANLFFQLVSARYERASVIVISNKPFGRWGEVFGDDVVAAAMIDRLVHHADVVALKGDSYRLKDRDLGRIPAAATEES